MGLCTPPFPRQEQNVLCCSLAKSDAAELDAKTPPQQGVRQSLDSQMPSAAAKEYPASDFQVHPTIFWGEEETTPTTSGRLDELFTAYKRSYTVYKQSCNVDGNIKFEVQDFHQKSLSSWMADNKKYRILGKSRMTQHRPKEVGEFELLRSSCRGGVLQALWVIQHPATGR